VKHVVVQRLKKESLWFKINGKTISELNDMHLDILEKWFQELPKSLNRKRHLNCAYNFKRNQ
jgi:excinuclease ABC subunit A